MNCKLIVLLASAGLLVVASATPSAAHRRYAPRCYPTSPGLVVQTSGYQEPNGTYDSYSDYVRDVNGTPCGIECTSPWRSFTWFASPPGYACY
jgi:hypothetical protein